MKTMTCAQLGGPCETAISASSSDEMMKKGMEHLEAAHPEMAADIKATPQDDPKMVEWGTKFAADYAAAPEDAAEDAPAEAPAEEAPQV
jgi:predicted small metal-binding protein